jgi:hypothetical protein
VSFNKPLIAFRGQFEELLDTIWRRINHKYLKEPAQYFKILRTHQLHLKRYPFKEISAVKFWLTVEDDNIALKKFETPVDNDARDRYIESITDVVQRLLSSRSMGLLELSSLGNVDYMHRTVKEWIDRPDIWDQISQDTSDDFDPAFSLLKAETALLISGINGSLVFPGEMMQRIPMSGFEFPNPEPHIRNKEIFFIKSDLGLSLEYALLVILSGKKERCLPEGFKRMQYDLARLCIWWEMNATRGRWPSLQSSTA